MSEVLTRLVLGFDFSVGARAALRACHWLAARHGAGLTVVTAAPGAIDRRVVESVERRPLDERRRLLEDELLRRLAEYVRSQVRQEIAEPDVAIDYHLGFKPPAQLLLEAALRVGAELIVVGSVGNNAPEDGREVGVDVERLIRVSSRPVLALRAGMPFPPTRLLCPVDFSPASVRAFAWAVELARLGNGLVELLHVIPDDLGLGEVSSFYADGYRRALHTVAQNETTEFLARVDTSGVVTTVTHLDGAPAEAILARVATRDYDLVALGTVGRVEPMQLLVGSNAERIIRSVPTSLLVAPPVSAPASTGLFAPAESRQVA